jgi:hypothetical protein
MKDKQLSLRQRLDAIAAEGKEIKVTWEGGNDSGGYNMFIDGEEVNYGDTLYDEVVEDIVADAVDYGGWAGDFSADGSVYYDADRGAFIGEGKETESESATLEDISIEIRIPKALNFDAFEITTQGTFCWEELSIDCKFIISNGPVFPEHSEVEDTMNTYVRESVTHILETEEACREEEIGWVSNDWYISIGEFKEDGDELVHVIDNIDYSYNNTKYQSYHIPINE